MQRLGILVSLVFQKCAHSSLVEETLDVTLSVTLTPAAAHTTFKGPALGQLLRNRM